MSKPCCFSCVCFVPVQKEHDEGMQRDHWEEPIYGSCHRYAPKSRIVPDADSALIDSCWPQVISTDWCYEHKPVTCRNASCTSINQTAS